MPAKPDLERLFAADGPLARAIEGYRLRDQQVDMARRVLAAIEANDLLIAEAGTGTGKTFAYLAPALLSGGKVIISTGTKTLQDQLFNRDLPTVRKALGVPATVALLKGRSNYVCPYHLERSLAGGRLNSRAEVIHLNAIARFAKATATGDKAECRDVPDDSGAWPLATSTRDNCLGQECAYVKECFVVAARREALAADVVVVNHHLFFADVMLKDDGMGELLPACNTVIFDEAHQLPEVAGLFFGEAIGTGQLLDLARDVKLEGIAAAKDYTPLQDAARALEKATKDLRLAFKHEGMRLSFAQWQTHEAAVAALAELQGTLDELNKHIESQAGRSEGLANCLRRCGETIFQLRHWQTQKVGAGGTATTSDVEEIYVRWVEVGTYAVTLNLTPLSVANIFRRQLEGHPRAWIFTSATLAVGSDFSHYQQALGLSEATTGRWDSPFDYPANALLYCPQGLPEPNHPDYSEAVVEAAWPVIRASSAARGGAFVLCTSLRAMRRIHELLATRIAAAGAEMPLLLQGECSKSELLDRFRQLGNAVLVASQSFWEGVDVRGAALSLVVIDKLPFAPPDDPVLAARIDSLKQQGRNAFFEVQLPRAVISMKQGAGRLIRDEVDRGVLMVCDPRLIGKSYGRRIWQSLPPMRRSRELADVEAFFEAELV
ncbi:MAG: ATP-dependent DNA helicase [Gammaproteobacteria bacterium]|nr:ATP-dependent DNA helicase [Rhodocyclaceae bacterium]MBU3908488.1 ATP-dependent DNA helicase [Gammaproteobacteria bacterium]MBU3988629.1 ATP-dependent DNA helicase [Gammaproteobacteria bacterium]MBU4004516.1 ATP-dependent DNA helicase [Gammaproteobacteria bacterium]MBU4021119.1 ATP-dependent DNA helicase [Gammaproteobacteria bacterium]